MTQKHLLPLALAVLIGAVVLYVNRDWFAKAPIQITHRFHAFGGRFSDNGGAVPLLFEFSRKLKLTSVKVIAVSDLETNKSPHPAWSLTSDSNSVPTRGFLYGMVVPGMRPVYKESAPDPLDMGTKYRLLIEAGSLKLQHDFTLEP